VDEEIYDESKIRNLVDKNLQIQEKSSNSHPISIPVKEDGVNPIKQDN